MVDLQCGRSRTVGQPSSPMRPGEGARLVYREGERRSRDRRQRKPSSRSSWTPLGSVRYPILKLYLLFLLKLTFQCVSVNF